MLKFFTIVLSLFILHGVNAQGFQVGEFLKYRVHYGFLNAGFATLEVGESLYNGVPHFHVVGKGASSGAVRAFYKVDNLYETYFEKKNVIPSKFIRQITESSYKKDVMLLFDNSKKIVTINDLKNKRITFQKYDMQVQDMLSAFYHLRSNKASDFRTGEFYSEYVFMDEEVYPFKLKIDGRERIKTKFGWVNAIKLTPYVQKGRIFKKNKSVTMWVSDDDNLIPLSIHADLVIGTLKMDLIEYKNVKHPLIFMSK